MPSRERHRRSGSAAEASEEHHPRRSRSPRHHRHHHHRHHHHHHASSHRPKPQAAPVVLPMGASPLRKHDYTAYRPMFGLYLDIQKQIMLEDLKEDEVKGRWKSFVGKWNRGELAEGWYDSATLRKAQASAAEETEAEISPERERPVRRRSPEYEEQAKADHSSSDEDSVGPALPGTLVHQSGRGARSGPAIPNTQDLALRNEQEAEDRDTHRQDRRFAYKADRTLQKEQLDDLIPRAEAGSKDRMLEKKREKADANRAFASAKTEAGGVEEIPESDLLGDDDGGLAGLKKQKRDLDRKKNERELRKEEILRARKEELEERVAEYRAKEERTMKGLVELARARFG